MLEEDLEMLEDLEDLEDEEEMDESPNILVLKDHLNLGSKKFDKITFRAPQAKDMTHMSLFPKHGDLLKLAMKISDVAPPVLKSLSARDTLALSRKMMAFLSGGKD